MTAERVSGWRVLLAGTASVCWLAAPWILGLYLIVFLLTGQAHQAFDMILALMLWYVATAAQAPEPDPTLDGSRYRALRDMMVLTRNEDDQVVCYALRDPDDVPIAVQVATEDGFSNEATLIDEFVDGLRTEEAAHG